MESLPKPRACVFDLDGTLVDSLRDIAESLNKCLALLGLPPRDIQACRYLVGEGIPTLCRRAIGDTHPHLIERLIELVRPYYRTRMLVHTRPYAGVNDLLATFGRRGVRLGVLSNKPHDMTTRIVHAFWPDGLFDAVQGYAEDAERKPSPQSLLQMCAAWKIAPADTWVVGDTPTDVRTALAAGAAPIGITWGFRSREDLLAAGAAVIADTPGQLAALLEG